MAGRPVTDPSGYIPEEGLLDALNVAVALGQPLLIAGDPGSGKTEAAHYLAWRLGLEHRTDGQAEHALRFDTKSTTTARDLFYSFDALARFYAAQVGDQSAVDPARFISVNALGRAILQASDQEEAPAFAARCGLELAQRRRAVVLIDEIDKAPRDVPNDLLMEMEKLQFHVLETNQTFRAAPDLAPIIILTSNREQTLPDAFLRRCTFYVMPFPDAERLESILRTRLIQADDSDWRARLIDFFLRVRNAGFARPPGTAELIGFAHALQRLGLGSLRDVGGDRWTSVAATTLLKDWGDRARATPDVLRSLAR